MIYCTLNNWHCVLVYILTYHWKVMGIMASLTQYRSIKNYFKNSSVVLWEHWTSNNAKTARICAPSLVFFSKGLHTHSGNLVKQFFSNFYPLSRSFPEKVPKFQVPLAAGSFIVSLTWAFTCFGQWPYKRNTGKFKMAAAARGKFVWLETLRSARKTSLVQDGKSRVLPRAKHFNELFVLEDWFKVKNR